VYIVSFRSNDDRRPSKFIVLADSMKSAIKMAWEHGGADFQSRFDKSTGQAEQMKEGALRVLWWITHDEHRRNLDLGIHQRAPVNSPGYRVGDSDAVDTTPTAVHRPGLVVSDWSSTEKSWVSLHLWLRFAALWFAVVLIGFVEGYVLLPFGLASFLGAVFLTAFVVWRVAPKWLR
jgi:hypothetical protein